MRYAIAGLLAAMIASIFVLAALPVGSLGKASDLGSPLSNHAPGQAKKHEARDNENETHDWDNETDEMNGNVTAIAGGGGWYAVNMSGTLYKDTFGIFIGEEDNMSAGEFVFHARDQDATIHSTNFTSILVDNTSGDNLTYVKVSGWATYNKADGFWFHLVLVDNGTRSNDIVDLSIYKDTNQNWAMDEGMPLVEWIFNGLGGGNIWVCPGDS
jgi:hypothetical protein